MKRSKLDQIINIIREDVAAGIAVNNVSGEEIAGTPAADPGNPPVDKRKKRNVIFLGPESRTAWVRNLRPKIGKCSETRK